MFKRYYLIELEYAIDKDTYITHLVCVTTKRHIELSGIIKNLSPDVTEWRVVSVIRLDKNDALELMKLLDEPETKEKKA